MSKYFFTVNPNSSEGNCFEPCRDPSLNLPKHRVCGKYYRGPNNGIYKFFKNKCFLNCTTNAIRVKREKCSIRTR